MNSPFLVKLHHAFQSESRIYFVIDYLNGGDIFFHLKNDLSFDEDRVRFYLSEIIIALDCLHENGIIYRDLKPENLLLDQYGHIKLTDFGLCKFAKARRSLLCFLNCFTIEFEMNYNLELTNSFCGTPEYLAPEIVLGHAYGKEVDFWSLGLLKY